MGSNYEDVTRRWRDRVLGIDKRQPLKARNVFERGDRIYSYGEHFEMARPLRNRRREVTAFLVNGDTFSRTTNRHQATVRSVLDMGMAADIPKVIIPHSVLDAAGIDYDSIQLVAVNEDTWEDVHLDSAVFPYRAQWIDVGHRTERGGWQNSKTGVFIEENGYQYNPVDKPGPVEPEPPEPRYDYRRGWSEYEVARSEWEREHRAWRIRERIRHGEWEWVEARAVPNGQRAIAHLGHSWEEWEIIQDLGSSDVRYHRQWARHRMGESVVRAKLRYLARITCPTCHGTGELDTYIRPVYRGQTGIGPLTEDGAKRNDEWYRMAKHNWERGQLDDEPVPHWSINELSEYSTICPGCIGNGLRDAGSGKIWVTKHRWAYFLSGFDYQEPRPAYFFCELPPGAKPTTVEEAYETLKPPAVKMAEQSGREVMRQGDIFAIRTFLTAAVLMKLGGVRRKRTMITEEWDLPSWRRRGEETTRRTRTTAGAAYILGTNHEATEVIEVEGATYVRGTLTHAPEGRRPDHVRIKLGTGKEWFLAVKNTVPVG